ncbi:hypothetical protein E2C01_014566 [Portunus trituberculatus]|uniref:Carbohydrate kinase PfkB domain-containing protein n=1 Tax=Portunus trituberculatus TaxID=210409 RepID=A0A5B7DJK7_PORTR|nr:hypothetical protein [Portunus trituberculatus]
MVGSVHAHSTARPAGPGSHEELAGEMGGRQCGGPSDSGLFTGRTHSGTVTQSYGGVGRNLADALVRLGCHPFLVSAVGSDSHASALTAHNPKLIHQFEDELRRAPLVLMDGNLSQRTINYTLDLCSEAGVPGKIRDWVLGRELSHYEENIIQKFVVRDQFQALLWKDMTSYAMRRIDDGNPHE